MKMPSIALAMTLFAAGAASAAPDAALRTTAQQRADAEGTYQLDNGQRVRIFELDEKLYLEIGRYRKELVLVAPNRYASRDGAISMQAAPEVPGERIVLGYRRDARQAIPVLLASGQRHGRGNLD
jgi:hypothetical protein